MGAIIAHKLENQLFKMIVEFCPANDTKYMRAAIYIPPLNTHQHPTDIFVDTP